MKNITISVDEDDARRLRVAAAHAGQSLSRYLAEAGKRRMQDEGSGAERRSRQLEALDRMLARGALAIAEDGRMPTADERNER